MFTLRSVKREDLEGLYELGKLMTFINLPADRSMLKDKIESSLNSFSNPNDNLYHNHYIFVLVEDKTQRIVGTSGIHAKHGTPEEPHFFLKVNRIQKFSETLNTGLIHGTLQLGVETNGHSEIGGLVLHPNFRKNTFKLGKQLSFVRFLYMALHPNRFTPLIHTELMPPLDENGNSPLWEAIGRRFLHMDYTEADLLSRKNKEFILGLYPLDMIYATLLPPSARNAIGKVGPETIPVKNMLEKIGFEYTNEVDPFDGGPHYRAPLKEITVVKDMKAVNLQWHKEKIANPRPYLACIKNDQGQFEAHRLDGEVKDNLLTCSKEQKPDELSKINLKDEFSIIPL